MCECGWEHDVCERAPRGARVCSCLCAPVCSGVLHMQGMTSGWLETEVLWRKSEMSSSEVCYLFDVGRPLLSASVLGRPQHSHTSPYLPLMISLTPILLQLSSNSTPFSMVRSHVAVCARVYRNTEYITFHHFPWVCRLMVCMNFARIYQTELSCMKTKYVQHCISDM